MKTKRTKKSGGSVETQVMSHKTFVKNIEEVLKSELTSLQDRLPKGIAEDPIITSGDEADISSQLFDQHLSMSMKERNQKRIKEITYALNRLRQTDFGVCEECENEIEQKR